MTRTLSIACSALALGLFFAPVANATDSDSMAAHPEGMMHKEKMKHMDKKSMMHKDSMMKGDAMKADPMAK